MMGNFGRIGIGFGLLVLVFGASATAQSTVRGFKSDAPLSAGLIIATTKSDPTKVEVASIAEANRMYGVVVNLRDVPVSLSGNDPAQVYVATSGSYPMLVSLENGAIKVGDYLAMSTTNGIAAKATEEQTYVIGRALVDYNGADKVTMAQGGAAVGRVQADIAMTKNPLLKDTSVLTSSLHQVGDAIAGKPLSNQRLYMALAGFLVTMISVATLLYSGIRSALVAIGRNPLSHHSIVKSFYKVIFISLAIFLGGMFGVYLLLKI